MTSHTTDILWTQKKLITETLSKKNKFGIKFTLKYPNTSDAKEKKKPHNVNSMCSSSQMLQLRKQQITYK